MLRQFSDSQIIWLLLGAAQWTLVLSCAAFLGGSLLGMALTICRILPSRAMQIGAGGFVALIQSTPLLMLLFLTFFGLPLLGIETSAWFAACAGLILFAAAFLCEVWTSAIQSIGKGQWEAARSSGLSFLQSLRLVVAPQAVRLALPSTVGFSVQVIKGTALVSIIGFTELTKAGTTLNNVTFRPFFVFSIVALIYFALCFPLSVASRKLEARMLHK